MGFFDKLFNRKEQKEELKEDLNKGLEKTNKSMFEKITKAVAGKSTVDEDLLDNIEEALMSADVSLDTTVKIIDRLEKRVSEDKYINANQLYNMVKTEVVDMLSENNTVDEFVLPETNGKPYVMLVVGVNGVGKTTTIGKLAAKFKQSGKKVLLGAADTFRAAAVDQLDVWAKRAEVDIVNMGMNVDPASVAFETVDKAVREGYDIVLVDTAGRLHNKVNLMNELGKIKRVMKKVGEEFPHDVMLVLDGSTGQNALEQAKHFTAVTELSCLSVTKLDGTAKGGVVLAIADQLKIPIRFVGVGEQVHHLQEFNRRDYVESLFKAG